MSLAKVRISHVCPVDIPAVSVAELTVFVTVTTDGKEDVILIPCASGTTSDDPRLIVTGNMLLFLSNRVNGGKFPFFMDTHRLVKRNPPVKLSVNETGGSAAYLAGFA